MYKDMVKEAYEEILGLEKIAKYSSTHIYRTLKERHPEPSTDVARMWLSRANAATSSANRLDRASRKYFDLSQRAEDQGNRELYKALLDRCFRLQEGRDRRENFARLAKSQARNVKGDLVRREADRLLSDKSAFRSMRKSLAANNCKYFTKE